MSNKNNDDLKRQASENTLGLNPIIALRKKDLLASAKMVLTQAIKQPLHSVKHVAHFGVELKNVMFGKSALVPEGDDRRFNDPAWSQNPLYKRYLQTYLAWRKEPYLSGLRRTADTGKEVLVFVGRRGVRLEPFGGETPVRRGEG